VNINSEDEEKAIQEEGESENKPKNKGMFRDPVIQFNGVYFDQNLYPDSPDVRGKMHLLWGDIPSNLCPEQCSTEADYYTEAHPCEPSLCNFYTNNEEGQIES